MNSHPNNRCDLVMKGGITSGVVYPKALTELAKKYRFSSIGGTSAGAIAASFAAAAEYSRFHGSNAGFEALEKLPLEISECLLSLFQPAQEHEKLFRNILKFMDKEDASIVWFATKNFLKIKKSIKALPDTYYGICGGMTESDDGSLGLTDWLNRKLETVAGRLNGDGPLPDEPLTFGMLKSADVTLRTITTNLSRQSPETLPFSAGTYAKKDDLDKLLPTNVVNYIVSKQQAVRDDDLLEIPHNDDMPVILAVRLSLSFPILLSALPLYQHDWTLRLCKEKQETPQLCWFSDGGISSNFPVHLFDRVFPSQPTFGISLGDFDECRQEQDDDSGPGANRIWLPKKAISGIVRPVNQVSGIGTFLGSIFASAQNWQDSILSVMPGYRERIVNLSLKSDEGGLNLNMPKQLIDNLSSLGRQAGEEICTNFDFDEHRWRRVLSTFAAIEEFLEEVAVQFDPAQKQPLNQFLEKCSDGFVSGEPVVHSYKPKNPEQFAELIQKMDSLHQLAQQWTAGQSLRSRWNMPSPSASFRMFPREYLKSE